MSIIEIIISGQFLLALLVYAIVIAVTLLLMEQVRAKLNHHVLHWQWDHIAMPLAQAVLMVLFILLAYPAIFGIREAPAITSLLTQDDLRINYLINLLFIISLFFPLIPFIGGRYELVFPVQGMAACMMVFSWLAAGLSITGYSYWPGWEVAAWCVVLAVITHSLGIQLAQSVGHKLDEAFNVRDSGELSARGLVLFMQSPVILIYSAGLGRQL